MEDILDSFDNLDNSTKLYERANTGKRFTNYVIDHIAFYLFSLCIGFVLGIVLVILGNEEILYEEDPSVSSSLMDMVLGLIIMTIYYVFSEYLFKGKTIGKMITGTRAVTLDNERMDLQTTFIRTICRFIPFEAFSFLGERSVGWHDSISKTKVIVDKDWNE